jgi:Leucine-rich repeat (LRR) protein
MALIQSFAFWMMNNNYSDVDISRVDERFQNRLELMNLPKQVTGQQIRALFVDRSALLREPLIGKIDFAHRTFQEFLAAKAALNEDSLNVLLKQADNDQWREAIIVAAGLGRPREQKELLEKLLQMGNEQPDKRHYLHLLAVACLETTVEVDPLVRAEMLKQAQALLPPEDDDEVLMVAKAGDAIVPLLAPNPNYSQQETARCVDALAKIGSSAAMEILADYAKDTCYELIGRLGRAWDAFDRSTYASKVLSHLNEVYVPNLSKWEGFEHLQHINKLSIGTLSLKDLSPLQKFTNLTKLKISAADEICNLAELAKIPKLTHLLLGQTFKEGRFRLNTNVLSKLNNLNYLYLSNVDINEISSISQFISLSELILEHIEIRDFSPLTQLQNLLSLGIFNRYGSVDLRFLNKLNQLAFLYLASTGISHLDLLSNITNLESLSILEDSISDLSPLASLNKLTSLSIGAVILDNGGWFGFCKKINVNSSLEKLSNLTNLRLNRTGIDDISLLVYLPNLSNLILDGNDIHDIKPLASLPNLISLSIAEPNVRDISSLANCQSLRRLYLGAVEMPYERHSFFHQKTPITDISPLANLPHLTELVLGDTDVTDLSPLEGLPNLKIEILKN